MPTRLRLSCRALLIIVLVGPNFYSALRSAIVQFSSRFTLTGFIWLPGLGRCTKRYRSSWRSPIRAFHITSMTQERLDNLAIMSIESDILRELDFAAITCVITLLRQNREKRLVFEFRLCVGRYDLKLLIIIWLIIILLYSILLSTSN